MRHILEKGMEVMGGGPWNDAGFQRTDTADSPRTLINVVRRESITSYISYLYILVDLEKANESQLGGK
jgi:hypothetical protein